MINVDVKIKTNWLWEKDYTCNPATCSYKNGKYLKSVINDSPVT